MIRIENWPKLSSGNKDLLIMRPDDKGFKFFDDILGEVVYNGFAWQTASGIEEVTKNHLDIKSDGYIEIECKAVINCMVNGKQLNGQLNKDFAPNRYYGFETTGTQNIKLIIKK